MKFIRPPEGISPTCGLHAMGDKLPGNVLPRQQHAEPGCLLFSSNKTNPEKQHRQGKE